MVICLIFHDFNLSRPSVLTFSLDLIACYELPHFYISGQLIFSVPLDDLIPDLLSHESQYYFSFR